MLFFLIIHDSSRTRNLLSTPSAKKGIGRLTAAGTFSVLQHPDVGKMS